VVGRLDGGCAASVIVGIVFIFSAGTIVDGVT